MKRILNFVKGALGLAALAAFALVLVWLFGPLSQRVPVGQQAYPVGTVTPTAPPLPVTPTLEPYPPPQTPTVPPPATPTFTPTPRVTPPIPATPPIMPETYISKTLVVAKVGDGPGEIGVLAVPGVPAYGPSSIALGKESNIYILDKQNDRVAKFDSQGTFLHNIPYEQPLIGWDLRVDDRGLIYILDGGFYGPDPASITQRVKLYDQEGRLIREYPKPDWMEQMWWISIDENGDLLAGGWRTDGANIVVPLGNAQELYTPEQQRAAAKNGILMGKGYRVTGHRKSDDKKELHLYGQDDKLVLRFPLERDDGARFVAAIDFDQVGNTYVYMASGFADHPLGKLRKFDPRGNLIAAFDVPNPYHMPEHPLVVSDAGEVYYLLQKEDQVQVIKWEKQ